ncbi:MAG: hypothetical protein NC924_01795, partial [Candidatus Omnitrophica bacterium]|nr:hypothetical protein [Candidatus Omnitrophota bacterium]
GGAFRGIVATDMAEANRMLAKYRNGDFQMRDIDGVVLLLDRVNPEDVNKIPSEVAIVANEMSIHCETLAQKNGISACYGFNRIDENTRMRYREDIFGGAWQIGAEIFRNGDVLSFDGHTNRHVYHKSGFLYRGSVAVQKKEPRSSVSAPVAENVPSGSSVFPVHSRTAETLLRSASSRNKKIEHAIARTTQGLARLEKSRPRSPFYEGRSSLRQLRRDKSIRQLGKKLTRLALEESLIKEDVEAKQARMIEQAI